MSVSAISPAINNNTPQTSRLAERGVAVAGATSNATSGTKSGTSSGNIDGKETNADQTRNKTSGSTVQLSEEALAQIAKLKARDLEVRQHEAAHLAVAGALATGGPSFTFQKGPDGVNYAISGEVGIDVSPGSTPEETIARARIVQAAALAPATPSGQDLAVAAQARQLEQQAQTELAIQTAQESGAGTGPISANTANTASTQESSFKTSETDTTDAGQQNLDQRQQERINDFIRAYRVGNDINENPNKPNSSSLNVFA
jgi:hypothetical protein